MIGLISFQQGNVTSHVQLWANGTSNQGWVIKGYVDDCSTARIYNVSTIPRLIVTYTPPDTTPPRITDIDVWSSVGTHASYDVPVGSGIQLTTIPVGSVNRFYVKFSEPVTNLSASSFELRSAITSSTYALASGGAGFSYNSSTYTATFTLANPISSADKLTLKIFDTVTDAAGNRLDGEWVVNPTSTSDTGTKTFPSGNGSALGAFTFNIVVLPGDQDQDNDCDMGDLMAWQRNYDPSGSGNTFTDCDFDGDGDVDGDDKTLLMGSFGLNYNSF